MCADVHYVGPVGKDRHVGGVSIPLDPHENFLFFGGTEEEWDRLTSAGFVRERGEWIYKADKSCVMDYGQFDGTHYRWRVAGEDFDSVAKAFEAMAACNKERGASSEKKECCCCRKCDGCDCDSGNTFTPDAAKGMLAVSNRGIEAGTGMSGQGAGGGSVVSMVPLGPWNKESPVGASPVHGDTVATQDGGKEDCSCCCTPCDPENITYSRGNVITSDPVTSYLRADGLAIETGYGQMQTRSGAQEGLGYSPDSQALSIQGMGSESRPQSSGLAPSRPTVAVPGYAGPISKLARPGTQASEEKGGDCGCHCDCGGEESKSPKPPTRPMTIADAIMSPEKMAEPAVPAGIISPGPLAGHPGVISAGASDAAAFASFSRSLLADVLSVHGTIASAAITSARPEETAADVLSGDASSSVFTASRSALPTTLASAVLPVSLSTAIRTIAR